MRSPNKTFGTVASRASAGFSLNELMVALAVAAVLMGTAIPEFTELAAAQRATAQINALAGAVNSTRQLAISHNRTMTLCAGQGPRCGNRQDWHKGMLVFADTNNNRCLDDGEFVGARFAKPEAGATIVWRSFGNRAYLRFAATGVTDWQPGNFQYCPANQDARFARQLIINAQGRVRQATDSDGDGIRENAKGQPLSCGGD